MKYHKHQPYRKNNGFWSCRVCRWEFASYPNKDTCPGILRIERANDDYKTADQWKKLGYEVIIPEGKHWSTPDACSIVHSTTRYDYYHRRNVRKIGAGSNTASTGQAASGSQSDDNSNAACR